MADNGDTNGNTAANLEDDEEVQIPRPPVIEQDVKEMERRKRVKMIIESQVFKEELERIIESQLSEGYSPSTLAALQQVTELLLPNNTSGAFGGRMAIIPINDIRGIDAYRFDKLEKQLRCKLAAVNRLIEINGWSSSSNSLTIRISQDNEHFLTNPYPLNSNEITASSLLKVDMQGNTVDPGSTNFTYNRQAFFLHSALHLARPDIKSIIHLNNSSCVAISSLKKGLLCLCAEAAILGEISYHVFKGIVDEEERDAIGKSLGMFNKVLILRNYGILVCGASIEEAYFLAQNLVAACEIQLKFTSLDNVFEMSEDAIREARALLKDTVSNKSNNEDQENQESKNKVRKWKIYDLEFESKMRMLDNSGYRTGYIYKQPLLRIADKSKLKFDDVAIPPSSQSHLDDNWIAPLRKLVDAKRTQDRLGWVNTPNNYMRIEIQETGTDDPKTITKWVTEGSPSKQTTSIKINKSHQFVPLNVQPNEFRKRQKELKFNRLQNVISAGPQSEILEGATWEDASDGPNVQKDRILIGAASKGIIQKEYQHNARVYKSAYEKNPFDNVTEQELDEYRRYVELLQKGENVDDIPERVKQLHEKNLNELRSPLTDDGMFNLFKFNLITLQQNNSIRFSTYITIDLM